jgi:uncharacterized membrane protein
MEKEFSTKKIVLSGLMLAVVFLATYFIKIPYPLGYWNMGDAAVIISAAFLGPIGGFIAGGFGSALSDVALGYAIFAPFTLIIKGLEGVIVAIIYRRLAVKGENSTKYNGFLPIIVASAFGALLMVSGYFITELLILPVFVPDYGIVAAFAELIPNLAQGAVAVVVGSLIVRAIPKQNI